MQEISPHVYIDTSYAGVTLGAISWTHGLLLIDAPFRPDDVRSWRSALLNLGGGVDRLLVNLDAHYDRTLGVRAMECTVVAQEKVSTVYRNRPVTFKVQSTETGAEWELSNGLGTVRWSPPDLTFSQSMLIHWDASPLLLEYHPGPASGASWAIVQSQRLAFIGDAVALNQPPFLASADLPAWIDTLKLLLSAEYSDYLLISGRGGLVSEAEARFQLHFLEQAHGLLEELADRKASPEDAEKLAPDLLANFKIPEALESHYRNRLVWGLHQYYARHYRLVSADVEE